MVKEIKGLPKKNPPGTTYKDFSLLTSFSERDIKISDISLKTKLAEGLVLDIPLLSAAMQSVTGYNMAFALANEGGLPVLPRASTGKQVDIVKKIKSYEMNFVEQPVKANQDDTVGNVIRLIREFGHSNIPIVDKNNTFSGMVTLGDCLGRNLEERITEVMTPFSDSGLPLDLNARIPYCNDPNISPEKVKDLFRKNGKKVLVILDSLNRLEKLAFKRDAEKLKIASAISTHPGWEEQVEANVGAGVDLIVIDTSNSNKIYSVNLIKKYKKEMKIKVPICAGNVITYDGALRLMEAGADIIKVGMASGSMCSTKIVKAVGRAPMTALIEVYRAQQDYKKKKYIPNMIDGGIEDSADIIISLPFTNAVMGGYLFNRFYESEGRKFKDRDGNHIAEEEGEIKHVEIYGEGSNIARSLDRYGHIGLSTFFEEGVVGTVPYWGRLKPYIIECTLKIKSALMDTGCTNLGEFREKAVIEYNTLSASLVLNTTYKISQQEKLE